MSKDSGISISTLHVDGGMTVNDLLLQLQADIIGMQVGKTFHCSNIFYNFTPLSLSLSLCLIYLPPLYHSSPRVHPLPTLLLSLSSPPSLPFTLSLSTSLLHPLSPPLPFTPPLSTSPLHPPLSPPLSFTPLSPSLPFTLSPSPPSLHLSPSPPSLSTSPLHPPLSTSPLHPPLSPPLPFTPLSLHLPPSSHPILFLLKVRNHMVETTALGAAIAAGVALGISNLDTSRPPVNSDTFCPTTSSDGKHAILCIIVDIYML